ncbi:ABC transporter substrate-binding protein [Hyphomicrobiales bacterium 4NK60-0047b]
MLNKATGKAIARAEIKFTGLNRFLQGMFPVSRSLGICFLAVLLGSSQSYAETSPQLKISTWAGAYKISQEKAFFGPFSTKTGTKIAVSTHKKPLDLLKQWKESESQSHDLIDLSSFEAEQACDAGYLLSLNEEEIAKGANGERIEKDFMSNSLIDCAVPSVAWSALMVVKNGAFKKKKPRSWADFFNLKRFPGKRSMKKSARYSLETALLAGGVKAEDLYYNLGTIAGQKRAFKKLTSLKDNIVWWETSNDAINNLKMSDTVMGLAFNGRLFNSIIGDGLDVTLIWQGQLYDLDYWAIPSNAKNRPGALAFINFATAPKQLAEQSKWMPYGPMRVSSLKFIGKHNIANIHMAPYLPTTKAHFQRAIKFNEGFWESSKGKELEDRFKAWLDGSLSWPEQGEKQAK